MKAQAVVMHPADNTATAVELIAAGNEVAISVGGKRIKIIASEPIKFGHKFAIFAIAKGERIIKYGETIGLATEAIKVGQHVHVHNLESGRGGGIASGQS